MLPGSLYTGINGLGVFGINEIRSIPGSTRQAVRFNDNIFFDGMIKLKIKCKLMMITGKAASDPNL